MYVNEYTECEHTMDDRLIENITPCEKLCFMILDQHQRLEEQMERLIAFVERNDRWTVYNSFVHSSTLGSRQLIPGMYRVESLVNDIFSKLSITRSRELLQILFDRYSQYIDVIFEEKSYTNNQRYMCVRGHNFNFEGLRGQIKDNLEYNACLHHIALHKLPVNLWKMLSNAEISVFRNIYD